MLTAGATPATVLQLRFLPTSRFELIAIGFSPQKVWHRYCTLTFRVVQETGCKEAQ
jgi:hypothetical protein